MAALSLRYVALGDSTGVGVGGREGGYVEHLFQRLRGELQGVGLLNLAVSGATSATVRDGQLSRALGARPHLVTLSVGVNDLWRGVSAAELEANLSAVVGPLREGGAEVVLANLPDMTLAPVLRWVPAGFLSPEAIRERLVTFNGAVGRVAIRHGCAPVDIFGASRDELRERAAHFFSADGFHPSDAGYRRLAELWWPTFFSAGQRSHGR